MPKKKNKIAHICLSEWFMTCQESHSRDSIVNYVIKKVILYFKDKYIIILCSEILIFIVWLIGWLKDWLHYNLSNRLLGRQDPYPLDSSRSYCLQEVYVSQWCMELWHCPLGSDVIRRTTILGNVQSGCEYCCVAKLSRCICAAHLSLQHCCQLWWGRRLKCRWGA